ncbi:YfiR family protein [Chromobacterium phragmitis]|nr:YfiR family protein [Chromobacterium phragmitis]
MAAAFSFRPALRRLLIAFSLLFAPLFASADDPSIEYPVKAAYLLRFTDYVEWPAASFPQADTPLVIAVLGSDRFAQTLGQLLAGRSYHQHAFRIRTVKPGDNLDGVQMLFVSQQAQSAFHRIAGGLDDKPVLTITEAAGDMPPGSVINFVKTDNRVGFVISLANARRVNLKLSSRLLSVAMRVEGG